MSSSPTPSADSNSKRGNFRRLHVESLEPRHLLATVVVDAAADNRAISSLIYGVGSSDSLDLNAPTQAQIAEIGASLSRIGGNLLTRYNWQIEAANHAADYFFESIAHGSGTPGKTMVDFVHKSVGAGAAASVTVPIINYVAKLGPNRSILPSFSVAKYGQQQATDPWFPDAGNGIRTNGTKITNNDPTDANTPLTSAMQAGMVDHLIAQFGTSANGGVPFYTLDNELGLWHETHRDVFPTGVTMQDEFSRMLQAAQIIRARDTNAKILGPEEWGYLGYLYSGYDKQWSEINNNYNPNQFPDRANNGGMDHLPWLLSQFQAYQQTIGERLLDYLTVHYYPQGGEYDDSQNDLSAGEVTSTMQLLRNRSTRSLWDPNYTDESWQGQVYGKLNILPRLKGWIEQYYPGTQLGLTEYAWGAEKHMNGATAQADVLGIFGREGLDLATRFRVPPPGSPTFYAMKMFRNYDSSGSKFGDINARATVENPDNVSAFASRRASDGALTIMVVNKNLVDPNNISATTSIDLSFSNFNASGIAQHWQLAANNQSNLTISEITRRSDLNIVGNAFSVQVPRQSVSLFVIPKAPNQKPVLAQFGSNITYTENAQATIIAPSVTVSDADNANFNGGNATIELVGAGATDRLRIRQTPTLTTNGNQVLFNNLVIGFHSGGAGSTPLQIQFNARATISRVQVLLRNIIFESLGDNPVAGNRTIKMRVDDGAGGISDEVTKVVNVVAVNDPPWINLSGTMTYVENQPPKILAGGAVVTDADSSHFGGGELRVRVSQNASTTDRIEIRHQGTGAGQIGTTPNSKVLFGGTEIGSFTGGSGAGALIVSFNVNATVAAVQALARNISFRTLGDAPSELTRTITFRVSDDKNAWSNEVVKTVEVQAVNDAPLITGGTDYTYNLNVGSKFIGTTLGLIDPDSSDFATGRLLVRFTVGSDAANRLEVAGPFAFNGNNLVYNGTTIIGSRNNNGGIGTTSLFITLNENATLAISRQLIRNIVFRTVNGVSKHTRTVSFNITDGDGGTSNSVLQNINVI